MMLRACLLLGMIFAPISGATQSFSLISAGKAETCRNSMGVFAPCKRLYVTFSKYVPSDLQLKLEDKEIWRIEKISKSDPSTPLPVQLEQARFQRADEVKPGQPRIADNTLMLDLSANVEFTGSDFIVRLMSYNYPGTSTLDRRAKNAGASTYAPARGKSDADIYISGTFQAAGNSAPLFAIDSKLGGFVQLSKAHDYGALGVRSVFVSNQETNADPDSIKGMITYEKPIPLAHDFGLMLRSDVLGGEFNRQNSVRNIVNAGEVGIVLPRVDMKHAFLETELFGGYEAGANLRNPVNPNGSGRITRFLYGMDLYFYPPKGNAGFRRWDFNGSFRERVLERPEVFVAMAANNKQIIAYGTNPRPNINFELNYNFVSSFGVTVKYFWGSLPPEFTFVDHQATVGLKVAFRQNTHRRALDRMDQ